MSVIQGGLIVIPAGGGGVGPPGPPGPPGPAGPPASFSNEVFTPILNQTVFVLAATPISPIVLSVNGVIYQLTADYTLAVATVTWLNTLFNLGPSDTVQVFYQV